MALSPPAGYWRGICIDQLSTLRQRLDLTQPGPLALSDRSQLTGIKPCLQIALHHEPDIHLVR